MIQKFSRWFRMYGDMPDDLKIAKLTDKQFRIFVEILCFQCLDGDDEGRTGMTVEQFQWRSRRGDISLEILAICELKLCKIGANRELIVVNWKKRQFKSDNETSTERTRKFKKSKKPNDAQEREQRVIVPGNNEGTIGNISGERYRSEQNRTDQNRVPQTPKGASSAFEVFWEGYPRRERKKQALESWRKLKPSPGLIEHIMSALEIQKQSDQWKRGIIPHAVTWLNQHRWEDEIEAPPTEADSWATPEDDPRLQRLFPNSGDAA